jgi:hypothetical protein
MTTNNGHNEMIHAVINLPFAVLRNISKPVPGTVKSLNDFYDFAVPVYDEDTNKEFCIFYQADVDVEVLKNYTQSLAIKMAKDAIERNFNNFTRSKKTCIKFSNNRTKPKGVDEILKIALYDQPNRKSVIGSHKKPGEEAVPTVNLKLPRGITLHISPVRDWPAQFHYREASGTVSLFGKEATFFIRKAHMNLMDYVTPELIQEEFQKAMKNAFAFFSYYTSDIPPPWEAKLEFI